jgi:hypothetical protein
MYAPMNVLSIRTNIVNAVPKPAANVPLNAGGRSYLPPLFKCETIKPAIMKSNRKDKTPPKKDPKDINPEAGTGKQDREQSRTQQTGNTDQFDPEKKNPTQESITFEQDIENERQNDPERNPQKRRPPHEDESEVAKQGKDFEPGIDESDTNL